MTAPGDDSQNLARRDAEQPAHQIHRIDAVVDPAATWHARRVDPPAATRAAGPGLWQRAMQRLQVALRGPDSSLVDPAFDLLIPRHEPLRALEGKIDHAGAANRLDDCVG